MYIVHEFLGGVDARETQFFFILCIYSACKYTTFVSIPQVYCTKNILFYAVRHENCIKEDKFQKPVPCFCIGFKGCH